MSAPTEGTATDLHESSQAEGKGLRGVAAALANSRSAVALLAYVAAAIPVVLFGVGRDHWFFRDEWAFLADRDLGSVNDIFRPHNEHWTSFGVVVFRTLYATFGLRSYVPYQLVAVMMHLAVVLLLTVTIRRAEVSGWLASAAASSFVLFGPGSQNIVSAFQIAFTGALAFGLLQILLADHDGELGRRDIAGLCAGAFGLTCSGLSLPLVAACGVIVVVRRGLAAAVFHTVPLGVLYGTWWLVYRPSTGSELFGRPSLGTLVEWVRSGEIGAFAELGHYRIVGLALAVATVGGVLTVLRRERSRFLLGRFLVPVVLFGAGVALLVLIAQGRWWLGADNARINRYVYLTTALSLPLIAVAADELTRRWRALLPFAMALFFVAIPANAAGFTREPFDAAYHERQERFLRAIPAMSIATEVPPDTAPFDPEVSPYLTVGFLLEASRAGDLAPPMSPLTAAERDELTVRLGIDSGDWAGTVGECVDIRSGVEIEPQIGDQFIAFLPVDVAYLRDGQQSGKVRFNANFLRPVVLTVQLNGLPLGISTASGDAGQLCRP